MKLNEKFFITFLAAAFIFHSSVIKAQMKDALPATDIYLLDISKNDKGKYIAQNYQRITDWSGYDNQPWFLPDGSGFYYVSVREDEHADVYKYSFAETRSIHVISTPITSEYSPQQMPDKSGMSVVRVMEDDSTQLLYKFTNKNDDPTALFPKVQPVGYYCWVNATTVAMFILGEPNTLQLGNITTKETKKIADNIGRCMLKMPVKGDIFSYVDKTDSPGYVIKSYDLKSGDSKTVVRCMPGEEDYCWLPDGTLLQGSGSILYKYTPGEDEKWIKVTDFKDTPVAKFYRIACNAKGDKLAIVVYPEEKP